MERMAAENMRILRKDERQTGNSHKETETGMSYGEKETGAQEMKILWKLDRQRGT